MLQRIQTLLLFLATLALGALAVSPFLSVTQSMEGSGFFSDGIFDIHDHLLFMVLFSVALLITLFSIFSYRNRPLQLKLNTWSRWAVLLGYAALFVLLFLRENEVLTQGFRPGVGLFLPPVFWVLSLMASKHIKKDENLVKSMDRLR